MDSLCCQTCREMTSQFSILRCDHVICAECLWNSVKTQLQGINTIKCTCGTVTKFTSTPPNNLNLGNVTVTTSPRRQFAKNIKTEAATFSVRAPSSPSKSRYIRQQQKPMGQLQTQLDFLEIQFKKTIEEVERNFKRVIQSIKIKHQNLIKNTRMFWFEQVLQNKSLAILQLPKLLLRKYQKTVGIHIQKLNESFLQLIASFRLETQTGQRIYTSSSCCKHNGYERNKQNFMNKNTCIQERYKLLQAIEQLKQTRGIKKIGRKAKPIFYRI